MKKVSSVIVALFVSCTALEVEAFTPEQISNETKAPYEEKVELVDGLFCTDTTGVVDAIYIEGEDITKWTMDIDETGRYWRISGFQYLRPSEIEVVSNSVIIYHNVEDIELHLFRTEFDLSEVETEYEPVEITFKPSVGDWD